MTDDDVLILFIPVTASTTRRIHMKVIVVVSSVLLAVCVALFTVNDVVRENNLAACSMCLFVLTQTQKAAPTESCGVLFPAPLNVLQPLCIQLRSLPAASSRQCCVDAFYCEEDFFESSASAKTQKLVIPAYLLLEKWATQHTLIMTKIQWCYDYFEVGAPWFTQVPHWHYSIARCFMSAGRTDVAEKALLTAVQMEPKFADAHHLLAKIWIETNTSQALLAAQNAVVSGGHVLAHMLTLANVYHRAGLISDRFTVLHHATSIHPNISDSWYELGYAFLTGGDCHNASSALSQAVSLDPYDDVAHSNLAVSLYECSRPNEALRHFETAASLRPTSESHLSNVVQAEWSQGDTMRTIGALRLKSRLRLLTAADLSLLVQLQAYTCSGWENWETDYSMVRHQLLAALTQGNHSALQPWTPSRSLLLPYHPGVSLALCRYYASKTLSLVYERRALLPAFNYPLVAGITGLKRVRVGYVSYHYGKSIRVGLMQAVFETHSRNRHRSEVFAFAVNPHDPSASPTEQSTTSLMFEHFIALSGDTDDMAASINARQVHVLVDILGLHSDGTRLYEIYAAHPALTQVSYMAFAGSGGTSFIDHITTDRVTSPPEFAVEFYSESMLYLPHCYHVNSHKSRFPSFSEPLDFAEHRRQARADNNLPLTGTLFASFNQFLKMDPATFDLWLDVLRNVENSSLVFIEMNFHQEALTNLRARAARKGVRGDRLLSIPKANLGDHLTRITALDVYLDTRLQNAHTTAVDSMWASLPLVTLPSLSLAARTAASMCIAAGMSESVARSSSDFVAIASSLAKPAQQIQPAFSPQPRDVGDVAVHGAVEANFIRWRHKLRVNSASSWLYDTAGWVGDFECAWRLLWECCVHADARMHVVVAAYN